MKWSLVMVSVILIVVSLLLPETATTLNYVVPIVNDMKIRCPGAGGKAPCYTLQEYASQQDTYFINNTIFYFFPGLHKLEESLRLISIRNLSFQGVHGNDSEMVRITFNSSASMKWENCSDIEISSVLIVLLDTFTFSITFKFTHSVQIFNISIHGNGSSGCSSILSQKSVLNITNSQFIGIQGYSGAALMIRASSNITFAGSNIFESNIAKYGGAIYLHNSVLIMYASGATFFKNNSVTGDLDGSVCNFFDETVVSYYYYYGGAIYSNNSTLTLKGQSMIIFAENKAVEQYGGAGGAMAVVNGNFTIQGFALFYNNHAADGGALLLTEDVNSRFCGAITFDKNTADVGGALYIRNINISFNVDLMADNSTIIKFQNNRARYNGGAISSLSSSLTFTKTVLFEANSAYYYYGDGGAMSLLASSKLILVPSLNVSFIKNHANNAGGALYIKDLQCLLGSLVPIECFISIQNSHATTRDILLHFEYNSAGSAGSILYGGQLNKCRLYYRTNYTTMIDRCGTSASYNYSDDALGLFMNMSRIMSESATNISSQAEKIKFCQGDDILQYRRSRSDINLYPGEQFSIRVIALGQSGSPVPTTVFNQNQYPGDECYIISPSSHPIYNGSCTNITFKVISVEENYCGSWTMIKLYPENPCQSRVDGLSVYINILPCPIGFHLLDGRCTCNDKLQKFTHNCKIDDSIGVIERTKNNFWISLINTDILIIHEYRCPLDYCKDSVNISLHDPSVQCDLHRNGTLCGQCQNNFSLALGSLHCISCDNNHTALIVLFAIAGIALVAIIFTFRLTVSVGTLNGLFFYANIVQANHQAFFPRAKINMFTAFISWLNLDLGIETCFYDGMDIYAYSWFQFLFPFYVWFLIVCVILACRHSQSIASRLGQNPVAVLATLLLMSYSKILQAIIIPLSWTYLTYYTPSNETRNIVWLYDASILFFKEPKHIALGLFAILSLVMFALPYIFLLLFGHWLQGYSNWWILSWLNKLKPVMDAYHAPYVKEARYWTGLLLLLRVGLYLTFAINTFGNNTINILAVFTVTAVFLAMKRRVYEHWCKDILESSFILNLCILSVATFYLNEGFDENIKSQHIPSLVSIGVAFITCIGILLFHISLVLKSSSIWKVHILPLIKTSQLLTTIIRSAPVKPENTAAGGMEAAELHTLPTSTEIDVDLREPLLEITESQAAT